MRLEVDEQIGYEIVRLAERKSWSITDTISDMLLAYAGCNTREQYTRRVYGGILP